MKANTAVAIAAVAVIGVAGVAANPPTPDFELPGAGCAVPDCRARGGWGEQQPDGGEVDCHLAGPFAIDGVPQWYGCSYVAPADHVVGAECVRVACDYHLGDTAP